MWISKETLKDALEKQERDFKNLKNTINSSNEEYYRVKSQIHDILVRHNVLRKEYDELLKYFNIEQVELPATFVTRHKEI
jgi:mRNA-degrading endonuclease HigB of HigAB toxin-antitoxin module